MPAKDIFHEAAKEALINDGWEITHDPYTLQMEKHNMYIDLGAEKLIAATKGKQKIAVEVKSLISRSMISAFHELVGQFITYSSVLKKQESERVLYVAIPYDGYATLFQKDFVVDIISEFKVRIFVFEPDDKKILKWLK
ncbi:MAG: XisH family protein [Phaeodactylibacter sp.]|nr:XisH family protein [Phaeodactylibacter sp.]